jgi:hypothetical protein
MSPSKTPDLDAALQQVDAATTRLGTNMGLLSQAVDAASIRIDAAVNALAAAPTPQDIAALKTLVDGETTKLDLVAANLESTATAVNGWAQTPTDPVPEPPPEVPPEVVP